MNKINFKLLSAAFLLSTALINAQGDDETNNNDGDITGRPFFVGRSQGDNLARRFVGEIHYFSDCCNYANCFNGITSLAIQGGQTFDRDEIGKFFSFDKERTNTMKFAGAATAPADKDVDGINFLLGDDFSGELTLKPQVTDLIIELYTRLNLYEWCNGLYFEIWLPVNWSKWDLDLKETVTNASTGIAAGELTTDPATSPFKSIIEAFKGEQTVGNVQQLQKARINGSQTKTSVAELKFILGYDFICNDYGHLGLNLRVYAPTGTRPDADFLFEPIVGNGHHTALGFGVSAAAVLWDNGCDQCFSVWLEGVGYHLFNAKQERTFDLSKNGAGSRYLLLKQFNVDASEVLALQRGANITTLDTRSDFGFVGEGLFLLDYKRCGFTFDVGYDVWGRTKENLTIKGDIQANTYAIKGDTDFDGLNSASCTRIDGSDSIVDPAIVFIRTEDLDIEKAEFPSTLAHMVFAHINYAWEDCDWTPFVGIGGMAQFSGKDNKAFDKWGVWAKGGFFFA